MNRILSIIGLFIVAASAALSQPLDEKLLETIDTEDRVQAIAELERLRTADPKAFKSGNLDYLLGKITSDRDEMGRAVAALQRISSTDSELKPYALKRLAEIARSTGNLLLEKLYITELAEFAPKSAAAKSVNFRLARNAFETGNYNETVRLLTLRDAEAKAENIRNDRLLLAMSYLKLGQTEVSRQMFAELLDQTPNAAQPDDIALEAVVNLDAIFGGTRGKTAPQLTEFEHQRRAAVYQFNREFVDARFHYQALLAGYPTSTAAADAIFQIGRGYAQQTNYLEALKWFERVIEQYPHTVAAKDALLQAASAYARVSRPREAINRYELFIAKYADDERLDRAYLNIVDIVRDQGEDTDALKRCDKIREVFRGKLPEAIAMFTQVRIHLAREDWPNAIETIDKLKAFSDLGGSRVPGGTSREELAFLRAFSLEKQKRFAEAVEGYLAIPDGRGDYFGWRSTERLKAIAADPTGKGVIAMETGRAAAGLTSGEIAGETKTAISVLRMSEDAELRKKAIDLLRKHLPPLPKGLAAEIPFDVIYGNGTTRPSESGIQLKTGNPFADRLVSLRLFDEAAAELERESLQPGAKRAAILEVLHRGDRSDLVIAAVEPMWQAVAADRPLELMPRRGGLELLYPVAFRDETVSNATAAGIDPRLMLAIMRQESRFRSTAKSNAAARGLMQFISTTSNTVAAKLGREGFRQDELYIPATAINVGASYLADLFVVFPGQTEAVVASYNGGDDNMKRWFNRARSNEPERYVPEVVYSQSKDYVHKVIASYRVYQFLYDEKLMPRTE